MGLSCGKDQQLPIAPVHRYQLVPLAVKGNLIGLHCVRQTGGMSNRIPRSESPFLGCYQDVQYIPWICETFHPTRQVMNMTRLHPVVLLSSINVVISFYLPDSESIAALLCARYYRASVPRLVSGSECGRQYTSEM